MEPIYIESVPNRHSPPAILLRESFRGDDGKAKKRTIANLTALDPEVIAGLKVLRKGGSASDQALEDQFDVERTLPHGHVATALGMFRKLGMFPLLSRTPCEERSLAAALIISRLIDPGSKLALSRQLSDESATTSLGEELGLNKRVGEKDLYSAMAWLLSRQNRIEKSLAKKNLGEGKPIFYDLTSTYYEGSTCVLAQRGYSRDEKKGPFRSTLDCSARRKVARWRRKVARGIPPIPRRWRFKWTSSAIVLEWKKSFSSATGEC